MSQGALGCGGTGADESWNVRLHPLYNAALKRAFVICIHPTRPSPEPGGLRVPAPAAAGLVDYKAKPGLKAEANAGMGGLFLGVLHADVRTF